MNRAASTTMRAAVSGTDRPRPFAGVAVTAAADPAEAAAGTGAGAGLGSCVVTWSTSCCGQEPRSRDRAAGQVGDDLALRHDVHPVGDLDGLFVVGRGDEHRDALGGEDAERLVDVLASADVDAPGRLDEHEHGALALQPAAQQHLLLVAAR